MEYNPINALKMKSFSGYTPKKPYRWAVTNVCCQFLCIPVIPEKSFVTRGYKHVGILHAHTLTCLLNGSAHETQSFSPELRKTKKLDTN